MSVAAPPDATAARVPGLALALGFGALAAGAAALSGALPVSFAFATVFLFAGPHNWFEARYALGRLPARTGKLWGFFVVSAVGIVGLTAGYAVLPFAASLFDDPEAATGLYAGWGSAFLLWAALLVRMRSRTNPRFDGGWAWPVALFGCAGVWLNPAALPFALVYLHPLMALWLLDRELARSRPSWRRAYWCAAAAVPLLLLALWWQLRDSPALPGTDQVTLAFAPRALGDTLEQHAGAGLLYGVSPHFLVAAHTFLEMVHYGVWVVLIPLIGLRSRPWELKAIPAARPSRSRARVVAAILLLGLVAVLVLWVCFGIDYQATRRVYFTVAMLHVLAEVPFLLRMV
ncbi:MAG: hypothetical protein ACKODX_20825 [Gemmata sp.]